MGKKKTEAPLILKPREPQRTKRDSKIPGGERRAVHVEPQKAFFVAMLTRDISTRSCVLDLIDNAIDAASRPEVSAAGSAFAVNVILDRESFEIQDNCGGIGVTVATDYAFHFGRRVDAPRVDGGIGMYGIGMKRALFKLGRQIRIESYTQNDGFEMDIDVDAWSKSKDPNWDFVLQTVIPGSPPGTRIRVSRLNPGIGSEIADNFFVNDIVRVISRAYSTFLQRGFEIKVNGSPVKPYVFRLRASSEHRPLHRNMLLGDVSVSISAGLSELPPEDDSAEFSGKTRTEHFGWYVLCNGRVVLAGDKTATTGWGVGVPTWHPQYSGFLGIVDFRAADPGQLPWDTTKSGIDTSGLVYQRALVEMMKVAKAYTEYTTARKGNKPKAVQLEKNTVPVSLVDLEESDRLVLPQITKLSDRVEVSTITYQVDKSKLTKVARALGNSSMSPKQVGTKTFEYYFQREVEEK